MYTRRGGAAAAVAAAACGTCVAHGRRTSKESPCTRSPPAAPRPPAPPALGGGAGGRASQGVSERPLRRLLGLEGGEEALDVRPDVGDAGQQGVGARVGVLLAARAGY